MDAIAFLKTIYLGDRGCKSLFIDGWNSEVKMQVTSLSRVRSATWDFYTDEDLDNGFLVFEEVKSIKFDPPGFIPNDFINYVHAELLMNDEAKYLISLSVNSASSVGENQEVIITIKANSVALEDQNTPGKRIMK